MAGERLNSYHGSCTAPNQREAGNDIYVNADRANVIYEFSNRDGRRGKR